MPPLTPATDPFTPILRALQTHQVAAVVVGGLAVVLHGHARLTRDVDVAIDMAPANVARLLAACASLGLTPAVPEPAAAFADPVRRADWVAHRGMIAFPWTLPDGLLHLDVLLAPAVPFADLARDAIAMPVLGVPLRVASLAHLIALKTAADRPQDREDLRRLHVLAAAPVATPRAGQPPAAATASPHRDRDTWP